MDARLLAYGDMVKYHNTVLHFIGIKKEGNSGDFDRDYCAIYDGIYPVKAMVVDESIEPVLIDKESLELNGFTMYVDEETKKWTAYHNGGITVQQGQLGIPDIEIDHYIGERVESKYSKFWHQLQAMCRAVGLGATSVRWIGKDDIK